MCKIFNSQPSTYEYNINTAGYRKYYNNKESNNNAVLLWFFNFNLTCHNHHHHEIQISSSFHFLCSSVHRVHTNIYMLKRNYRSISIQIRNIENRILQTQVM